MASDFLLLAPALIVFLGLALWRYLRPKAQERPVPFPKNAIVVDGSNVMHWGGEPSLDILGRVLLAIEKEGLTPIVIFDANVGYKLEFRYRSGPSMAQLIGLPSGHVYVVDKGVVADQVILDFAAEHGLRVVSNDRFRDWSVRFPAIKKKGFLVRGRWQQGSVIWQGM